MIINTPRIPGPGNKLTIALCETAGGSVLLHLSCKDWGGGG